MVVVLLKTIKRFAGRRRTRSLEFLLPRTRERASDRLCRKRKTVFGFVTRKRNWSQSPLKRVQTTQSVITISSPQALAGPEEEKNLFQNIRQRRERNGGETFCQLRGCIGDTCNAIGQIGDWWSRWDGETFLHHSFPVFVWCSKH